MIEESIKITLDFLTKGEKKLKVALKGVNQKLKTFTTASKQTSKAQKELSQYFDSGTKKIVTFGKANQRLVNSMRSVTTSHKAAKNAVKTYQTTLSQATKKQILAARASKMLNRAVAMGGKAWSNLFATIHVGLGIFTKIMFLYEKYK